MVPLSSDSQRTSNNSDCPFISKQRQQMVQIFARDREYLGSCSCSGSSTLKLPRKPVSKYWTNTWNVSENLNEFLPSDTKWTEQLARTGCNLLDSNCQPKYQCSGGSLQSSHQKNMRFDCITFTIWCALCRFIRFRSPGPWAPVKVIPQYCIAHAYCAQFYAWLARAH